MTKEQLQIWFVESKLDEVKKKVESKEFIGYLLSHYFVDFPCVNTVTYVTHVLLEDGVTFQYSGVVEGEWVCLFFSLSWDMLVMISFLNN